MSISLINFNKLLKLFRNYEINSYSFSQGGEDIILRNIFYHKLTNNIIGFYIDIGAYHPYKGSNTFLFYLHGWQGINIDANKKAIAHFNKLRKRDININCAISDKEEELIYYYYGETFSINTFSEEYANKFGSNYNVEKIKMKTCRLDTILDKYLIPNQNIDFLNIDVEGLDYNVLLSNNWEKYRPNVIIVELSETKYDDIILTDTYKFLISKNYSMLTFIPMGNISSVFFTYNQM